MHVPMLMPRINVFPRRSIFRDFIDTAYRLRWKMKDPTGIIHPILDKD